MRKALKASGALPEWADVVRDLEALKETEIEVDGKHFMVRSEARGAAVRSLAVNGTPRATQALLELIDDLGKMGTRSITLGGGEPLLRNDIEEVVERVKANGIECGFNTNGLLIGKKINAFLVFWCLAMLLYYLYYAIEEIKA